jgi:WD40 repeat protein
MSDDFAPELPGDPPMSPYVGLVPYGEQDAAFFFGRADETRIVSGNLRASDLTLLYGASGVGKTSLLRAGVIHGLREQASRTRLALSERAPFAVCAFSSWRDSPLPALMETIRATTAEVVESDDVPAWHEGEAPVDALRAWTEQVRTLLVVLDQFEDYFLYHPEESGRGTFAGELPEIVNDPNLRVHVLLSIREDALAKLDRFKGSIPRLFANYVRVEHLSREAARDAIEGPLREWNSRLPSSEPPYELGPGLVEKVIDATATGGVTLVGNGGHTEGGHTEAQTPDRERVEAPFLQLVLERLWRAAKDEGVRDLTVERLDRLGGPQRIVENHLLDALGALSPSEQDVAADLFRFLVTSSKTKIAHTASDLGEWTGRKEPVVEPVLDQLCRGESGRILRRVPPPVTSNGATRYELYHDVLAEPILEWRREHDDDRRRRALRRRILRVGSGVLVLVAVITGLGLWALVQRNDARTATHSAASLALASAAEDQMPNRTDAALLLGLEAYREAPSPNAASALVDALTAARRSGASAIMRGHESGVRAVAVSPDARTVASADFDGEVRLWDLQEEEPLGTLLGHEADIWSVAFSPDGETLASASHDGTVRLWDVGEQTEAAVLEAGHDELATAVAWSPDGDVLASAGEPGDIHLWDPETHEALGKPLEGHENRVVSLAFNPIDGTLASASYDGTVRFWDVRSGKQVDELPNPHDGEVLSIAWSPDGRRLVSSGTDGVMHVWDPRTGQTIGDEFGPGSGDIWNVAWSPDGRTIASSGEDDTAQLWSARDGAPLGRLRGHTDRVVDVAFTPDSSMLVSSSYDTTVRTWTLPKPDVLGGPIGRHRFQGTAVAYRPDGSVLASADSGGTMRLWDLDSRKPSGQREDEATTSIDAIAWSPDGRTLASAGDALVLWDAENATARTALQGHEGSVRSIAWSPDGSMLVSGGADRTVRVWDIAERRQLAKLDGHEEAVESVAWSPDGRTLASSDVNGVLRFWDADERVPAGEARLEDSDIAESISFSPDGETLAVGTVNDLVQLWDVDARAPVGTLSGGEAEVRHVTFSPDGKLLLSFAEDGSLRLWDVAGRRQLGGALRASQSPVRGAQFAPDGMSFASVDQDGVVRVWEGILWRDLAGLQSEVCGLVVGNLSSAEWQELAPGLPERTTCPT